MKIKRRHQREKEQHAAEEYGKDGKNGEQRGGIIERRVRKLKMKWDKRRERREEKEEIIKTRKNQKNEWTDEEVQTIPVRGSHIMSM